MVTFIKPSSLNLSDLIYTHFCFSSCYLELNQWLCYTEPCALYHPSISGGNMLGCCLLSPFGFVACNFSSSLWFPPSLDHSFSHIAFFFSFFLYVSVLQFQSHFVMVITAIHASCLALPRPVWWRPVLFLWSSFKCQTRTIIKLFFMPSMRSPS